MKKTWGMSPTMLIGSVVTVLVLGYLWYASFAYTTYTNDTYGYSIKYERDWSVGNDLGSDTSEPSRVSWVEFQNKSKFGDAIVAVEVLKNTNTDINAWAKTMNKNVVGIVYEVRDIKVDGLDGKELSTNTEGGAVRTGVIKGNKLYVIHLMSVFDQKQNSELASAYEKMLSSYKFL